MSQLTTLLASQQLHLCKQQVSNQNWQLCCMWPMVSWSSEPLTLLTFHSCACMYWIYGLDVLHIWAFIGCIKQHFVFTSIGFFMCYFYCIYVLHQSASIYCHFLFSFYAFMCWAYGLLSVSSVRIYVLHLLVVIWCVYVLSLCVESMDIIMLNN